MYIAIFTYTVTRAVHLEVVNSISTVSFTQAFRRYVTERGMCSVVFSDNARTFKRVDKAISEGIKIIQDSRVKNFIATNHIKWKCFPEQTPWRSGSHERIIRSIKASMSR